MVPSCMQPIMKRAVLVVKPDRSSGLLTACSNTERVLLTQLVGLIECTCGLRQLKLANQILAEEQHQPMYKVRK